jgi:glycosyltransferase involved in cell wall biosynthesis
MNEAVNHEARQRGAGDVPQSPRSTIAKRTSQPAIGRAIRLLVFTSLYPNAAMPRHGVFVEERLRHLIDAGKVTATVVAPVPWFPFKHPRFGTYASHARVPLEEDRHGIRVLHPRYLVVPKIGMNVTPTLMYRALLPKVERLLEHPVGYDLIDAHYLYPDGVAAVAIGRQLGVPVVVTARGNDVTLIPQNANARRRIIEAVDGASAIATVSTALRTRLIELGAEGDKITVLRNGVDLERFQPVDGTAVRNRFGVTGAAWLAVGHLIERKGVHLVIQALRLFPDVTLLIAGDGPEEGTLRKLAQHLGVFDRVRFMGAIRHDDLPAYYCAVDALMLASSREGMPNVALESLACGTPVVAAPFAGVNEVVSGAVAGEVARSRTADALAAAWERLLERRPVRAVTRRYAEQLGWGPVVEAQHTWYAKVLEASGYRGTGEGE